MTSTQDNRWQELEGSSMAKRDVVATPDAVNG
jgi:hypothetical protein